MRFFTVFILIMSGFYGTVFAAEGKVFSRDNILGVHGEVQVFGAADSASADAIASAVFGEWERLDVKFGYYSAGSELSRINAAAAAGPVKIDSETYSLIEKGLEFSSMTGGHFDITFSPVWEKWRQCAVENRMPASAELESALTHVDYSAVILDSTAYTVRFSTPVSINLGGLLREYALRRGIAAVTPVLGGATILCSLGGDIVVQGNREKPWKFGIQNPDENGRLIGTVSFMEGFVVTTGAFERFVEIGGKKYCHIIDAKTGLPVEGISSVTAHFPDISNSYPSVVIFLLGRDAAQKAFAKLPGASFIYQKSGAQPEVYSPKGSAAVWNVFPAAAKSNK